MNILAVNGSPKGENSVTLQTIYYLEKLFPDHNFEVLHAGQRIKALEKDFTNAEDALNKADLIIFTYPVYTFIAPYQLHRFIELIKEKGINLENKFCTQLSTSKHFYDITAHKYIEENAKDLKMKYIKGLSADMEDLLNEKGRKEARDFFRYGNFSVENYLYESSNSLDCDFTPNAVTVFENNAEKEGDVVIITNCEENDLRLKNMIARFQNKLNRKSRVVNIREYQFKGGCLGCFNCAVSGKCIYKDGFDEFLRNEIQKGEAMVYAYTIKDHSMGASFKLYDDRQFCNGHRTVTMGMPVGYLVSGKLSAEQNLKMIMEARANVGSNFLAGIASDEFDPDAEIDNLALNLCYAIENKYVPPQNFLGIGGMKIFRDLIWLMQGMMKADHKFYKKHGQYDFPQKQRGKMMAMYLVGAMLSNDKIKSKMGNKMNEGMLMPYKKELSKLDRK